MKLNWSLCLLCLAVFVSCADAARRTSSSGRSRGSNRGTGSRGKAKAPAPSSSAGLSHEGLAGLSYSGYGQAAAKPKPKPAGWNVDTGETAVRKNTGTQSQSYPTNNQQSHSYPSNNQQSHSYPSNNQQSHSYPGNNQQSHSYPASSGLSGGTKQAPSYPANNPVGGNGAQQSHSYPAGSGLSGHGAGAPPAYPAQTGAVPPYSQSGYPHPQQHYPAGNYPGGGNPSYTGGFPNNGQQNYPGYSQPGPGGFGNVGGYGGGLGGGLGGGFGGGYNNKYGGGYGPPSRTGGNVLTGLGIAGAGVGTILTGLALYNLARGGSPRYVHHYHDKPSSSEEKLDPQTEAALSNLVNCTLTVQSPDVLEVLLIPCELANSFAPNANVKKGASDGQTPIDSNVNCTIAIFSKDGTETRTFIPCATLAKLGANSTDSAVPPSEQPLQPSQPPSGHPEFQPSAVTPIPFIPVQSIQQTPKPAECNPENPDPKCLPPPQPISDGDLTVIPLTSESSTVAPAA